MDPSKGVKRERTEGADDQQSQRRRTGGFDVEAAVARARAAAAAISRPSAASTLSQNAALLQQRIQEQIASVSKQLKAKTGTAAAAAAPGEASAPAAAKTGFKAPALILDEKGRQVDEEGNVVSQHFRPVATFKVNQRKQSRVINPYLAHHLPKSEQASAAAVLPSAAASPSVNGPTPGAAAASATEAPATGGYDPRLPAATRRAKAIPASFSFVEEGTFVKQAERIRSREAKAALEEAMTTARQAREEAAAQKKHPKIVLAPRRWEEPPDVEWWDAHFLPGSTRKARADVEAAKQEAARVKKRGGAAAGYEEVEIPEFVPSTYDEMKVEHQKSWKFVEHPVPVIAQQDKAAPKAMPLYLTKKERMRIRRQKRAERQKMKQEMILAGKMDAPAPKVKVSNLMRVLLNEAVADPSAVERRVREEMAKREQNHQMRNLARKLTPQEKREKMKKKMSETPLEGANVAVFRVTDLTNGQIRWKIEMNAAQLYLTGCIVPCHAENVCMVVAEGGRRALKKFTRLMTQRIDWNKKAPGEESDSEEEEEKQEKFGGIEKRCDLVWQGTVPRRNFPAFRVENECRSIETARRLMAQMNLAHYWDMVVKFNPHDQQKEWLPGMSSGEESSDDEMNGEEGSSEEKQLSGIDKFLFERKKAEADTEME